MKFYVLRILLIAANEFLVTEMLKIDPTDSRGLADCIVQATEYITKRVIAIEVAQEHQDFASEILKKLHLPVILNSVQSRKPSKIELRIYNNVILLLKDIEASKILNETLWNRDTRFLIVTENIQKLKKYFEDFWKLKVIKVFGMITNKGKKSFLYSFLPYRKCDCGVSEPIIVDTCVEGQLLSGGFALRDPMRIKNMNGCTVNITVTDVKPNVIFEPDGGRKDSFTIKGFEGNLMVEVAKIYNFRAHFQLPEDGIGWGWIHPSPHGAVGDLYLGVCEITIGMLSPLLERFENFDVSSSYNMDECVTFAVPQGYGAKRATWLTIFVFEFTFSTWILIILSFLTSGINIWLINRCLNADWVQSKAVIALLLFSSCLGGPIKIPDYGSAKTSIAFWILFGFITTVAYKASMGSKLAVPLRDPDINNFQELIDSDLELGGLENMNQLFVGYKEGLLAEIGKRYRFTNTSVEDVVDQIANNEKIAHLRHTSTFYYYSLINPKARGRIHVLKECVHSYHPLVLMKKFSPFTYRVSQTVRRLEESGIMSMWREKYIKRLSPTTKPFFRLSIHQMLGVFCFLCFGYVVALFSFLGEFVFMYGGRKTLSVVFRFSSLGCLESSTEKVAINNKTYRY